MVKEPGTLVISLDFELMWGVRDHRTVDTYGRNIAGVRQALPAMLSLFAAHQVNVTFATVGLLFAKSKVEMESSAPALKPRYRDGHLSPFNGHFALVGEDEREDPYHFAPSLIELLQRYPQHEIGTHTFSHYYCLEPGQTIIEFDADLGAAVGIARKNGVELKSIVFPRNQFNPSYLDVCRKHGLLCYRGNEEHWAHRAAPSGGRTLLRRALRFADQYVNLTGHHCSPVRDTGVPLNIPASRFLRPYIPALRWADALRLSRMKDSMTAAARTGGTFHLWWHPHNFGVHQAENLRILQKLLEHFGRLRERYGMRSETMLAMTERLQAGRTNA